jgi:hypothetical protein
VTRLQVLALVAAILTVGRDATALGLLALGCLALDLLSDYMTLPGRRAPEDPT